MPIERDQGGHKRSTAGSRVWHYNYFRTYSAERGRYTQADPIGLDGGFNRFGYVQGNPLLSTDSQGLQATVPTPLGPVPLPIPPVFAYPVSPPLIITDYGFSIPSAFPVTSLDFKVPGFGLCAQFLNWMFSNVRENNEKEVKAEEEVVADLEAAGFRVRRHVWHRTPFGPRIIDIEVRDENDELLGGIEVKVGGSRYRADQRAKDEWLRRAQKYPVSLVRKP